jgi:hypothetical protein
MTGRQFEIALREIPMPRSSLARAVEAALGETPDWVVAHSMRAWAFGCALARRDDVALDGEVFFAAALLHDPGLCTPDGEACFAHRGGELARTVCLRAGAEPRLAGRVANAICSHLNVVPSGDAESRFVRIGSGYDVIGARFFDLGPGLRAEVLERWPRAEFAATVNASLRAEAQSHPKTRIAFLCNTLGFNRLVDAADQRFLR